ncbi:S8 family serine peptidase [Arsukibacterium sp.]|uniref:S8 family serine peptidase n=1 Tax=Arsukibacterium sp. TaxID=1977258 RepID=UPI00299E7B7E|nr:S8 family serine peptidase [Arsukibacterium sp.]MDX1677333.1 S8 family serine peptidase [Arsukibacterium sp.]
MSSKKNKFAGSVRIASACLLAFSIQAALAQQQLPVNAAEGGNLWFVELSANPIADGNSKKNIAAAQGQFRKAAKDAGVQFKERRSFDTLFNGFSIEISPAERAKLMQIPGVKAIYPVELIQTPNPEINSGGSAADMATAISMTGADIAQNTLGYTGTGIKVAVMDSGIDIDHPDFGGNGSNGSTAFPTPRIAYGYDFVGDAFNADPTSPSYNPVPNPDDNPDDCGGHGTHVAGIVGANGTVVGVAPDVTFGAYRVFGCNGSTTADIMIAAMERAYADGMHILNMSIGSAFQWPQYPTAQAADRLVEQGMVVVASIGNSGGSGLYSAGAPGLGEHVIGVASFDNVTLSDVLQVAGRNITYNTMSFSVPAPTAGNEDLVFIGRACNGDPLLAIPAGKAALAERGVCTFREKALNAINAGATSVVIHNLNPGNFSGTLSGPVGPVPVVSISLEDGMFIRGQAAPVLTWTDQKLPVGGLISSFSSYGLSPDLALKPDIGAPGGSIFSTYPLERGGFATLSGTSMSSPHVAGSAALLLQAKPETPVMSVRSVLQNSADPKVWSLNPGLGFLDNVHRQGAGMVDVDDSITANTYITPGKIATGEGEAGPFSQRLTVYNNGTEAVTYQLSSVNALSTGGIITPSFFAGNASVSFSSDMLTVAPGSSATVDATITPATLPDYGQYGGYIVFTPDDGGQAYRVPFAGFVGDYQSIQVLAPTGNGFPWLAQLSGGFFAPCTVNCSYSMQGDDLPWFLIHFDHHARYMEMNILHAGSMQPVHPVFHKTNVYDYLPRNSTPTGFFTFSWDGTRIHSNGGKGKTKVVPDGDYVLQLRVLKALGDESNPAHWETWTSPVITIAR